MTIRAALIVAVGEIKNVQGEVVGQMGFEGLPSIMYIPDLQAVVYVQNESAHIMRFHSLDPNVVILDTIPLTEYEFGMYQRWLEMQKDAENMIRENGVLVDQLFGTD